MIPPVFDYVRPADLGEALRILKEREGEAKVLSGGFSLIPLLQLRLAQPALLGDPPRGRRGAAPRSGPRPPGPAAAAPTRSSSDGRETSRPSVRPSSSDSAR